MKEGRYMQLCEVPHIRINVDVYFEKEKDRRNIDVLFRLYKSPEETLSQDKIYSAFLDKEKVFIVGDDYGERISMADMIYDALPHRSTLLYISYDFSYTPVNLRYGLDKEFAFVGEMIEKALKETNLSLELLISHFNQFANKVGTKLKNEHYHCLIGNPSLSKAELENEINTFLKKLAQNKIIKNINIKE